MFNGEKKSCSQGFYFDEKLFIFSVFVGRRNKPPSVCVVLEFMENEAHSRSSVFNRFLGN